ncbi:hypothetical protein QTO34_004257 [Cnephaeus nilssonii]|uniref:L1 transposable element RRM domain-containing protein n=1 Tax=Cnephaeus nilssonii TaxID=3371016 RepID=A0AA40LKL3_CNENI|nr:hypothetical protein QTO34_004257 [Eptesicus nilssonii]
MEESKLMDNTVFRTTFVRLLNNLLKTAEKLEETFKDLNENTKKMEKDQSEIMHTLSEIKNIQKLNCRSPYPKSQTKNLEHEEAKNTQPERRKVRRILKCEDSVRSLWDGIKRTNIRIFGVPEEEREQDAENLFEEIMTENFPHLVKEIDLQVQEAHRTPNKRNPKRTTPRHIIIKMPREKDKERILKAAREKQLFTYKGVPIRLSADFSTETMQARREWQEIFKVMNSKNLQPRLLYPAKLSFRIEGQTKSFTDKKKLKEFITTKPGLHEMLKEKANKFSETLEDMKKNQLEIKHTLTEIKNIIQRPNSRLEEHKNQVKDLKYKEAKNTQPEKQKEKRIQKVEDSVRSFWDNFKCTNIRIMGVPEEEREQDTKNLFEEIMTENFPHLVKETDLQVQEAHRTPNKRNPKRTTPRHIIIKMPRAKDKEY